MSLCTTTLSNTLSNTNLNLLDLKQENALRQEVIQTFRAKSTPHLGRLIKTSSAVAKQFVPSPKELGDFGTKTPFEEGKNNRGIYGLERIYEDRAVLTPYFECAAYCRYCFKKTRTLAGEAKRMSDENIDQAIHYISKDSRISTVLITGGDPFIDAALLKKVLDKVVAIPHVTNIRVGTRNILFRPDSVTEEFADMLLSYNRVDFEKLTRSKVLGVGLSLNHADEISPDVAKATYRLIKRGIVVRGQVVLLKDVNDSVPAIRDLLKVFSCLGIVPYYLFHCMPVVGSEHFRTSVQKGLDILKNLSEFSGASNLLYVYVTQVGKHRLAPGQTLNYVDFGGKSYIRATTPYRADRFLEFADKDVLPPLHKVDSNGFIVSHYLDGQN